MKLSVIIPVYNAQTYLRECLESVRAQSFGDFEVICVDDGSTDLSPEILQEYERKDTRFKVVRQKNGGVGSARNTGLAHATGDYVTFLDNDDLVCVNWFAEAIGIIEKQHPDIIRFETHYGDTPEEGFRERRLNAPVEVWRGVQAYEHSWEILAERGFVWLCFIRRSIIGDLRFNVDLRVKDDVCFLMGLFPRIGLFCYVNFAGHFYRNTPGSGIKKPRKPLQCLAFIEICRDIWLEQRSQAAKLHCAEFVRKKLIHAVQRDIIEWACNPGGELHQKQLIQESYLRFCNDLNVSDSNWLDQKRFYVAFLLWKRTGMLWPIGLVDWLSHIVHRFRRLG